VRWERTRGDPNLEAIEALPTSVPAGPKRNPWSATGPLVNIGFLERELGGVEYRLSKLAAGSPERAGLEAQKAQVMKALDKENERLAKGPDA
jgi:hypothetical protein